MEIKKQDKFLELYEPVHAKFERFCRARVYGEMEYADLMNETLLTAYQKLEALRSESSFLSFLFSIAVRILANNNRKQKTERLGGNDGLLEFIDINANTSDKTDVYFLHKALSLLPDLQKESLILFEITGFSIKEIAEIQDSTETAVKQRLRRGRLRLKELLTPVIQRENSTVKYI